MKTAVLLSGCGVYDGVEIQESVFAILALSQNNIDYICTAPNINQYHVINHLNGDEINEKRNVLVESSRIARGNIISISKLDKNDISSLLIPGGFGAAKNLSDWAFTGPNGTVMKEVKDLILLSIESKEFVFLILFKESLLSSMILSKTLVIISIVILSNARKLYRNLDVW